MANGVMPGTGTREDPFIVEDGWDFNALRDVPASAFSSRAWIELGADISLSMFPVFTPIPGRFFEIDGKGYTIRNVNIFNGVGLFTTLFTHETKDIRIEGNIVTTVTTNNTNVGLLCGTLTLETSNSIGGTVSNIQCFGNITVNVNGLGTGTARSQGTGGYFGEVRPGSWAQHARVENSAFYGNIQYSINFAWPNANSANNSRGVGGVAGILTSDVANSNGLTLIDCISVATITIAGGGARGAYGGIVGSVRTASSRAMNISRCIARTVIQMANLTPIIAEITIGGIIGQSWAPFQHVSLCGAHTDIVYNPSESVAAILIGGLWSGFDSTNSGNHGSLINSYAVLRITNPNDQEWPEIMRVNGTMLISGTMQTLAVTGSFFDADVLAEGWSGTVENANMGVTTAQLQSAEFLESQGWVFADV